MGIQPDIPVFTSSPAAGVAQIYSGTHCAQVGLAVALLPLRPDSTMTDARSNRSWQLATGNTNTHMQLRVLRVQLRVLVCYSKTWLLGFQKYSAENTSMHFQDPKELPQSFFTSSNFLSHTHTVAHMQRTC